MNPKPKQESFFLIFMIILVLSEIQGCLCQQDLQYETCRQSFRCSNREDIRYPFWGNNRPESCGYPGFQLECRNDDVPLLTINSISYRVLEIDNNAYGLKVARRDLWVNLCPETLHNTTLDSNLFSFSPIYNNQNISLYYGCTMAGTQISQFPSGYNNISCQSYGSWNFVWRKDEQAGWQSMIDCSSNIFVPVDQTAAAQIGSASASTVDVLRSGFWIAWSASNSNCQKCEASGGVCGYNRISDSFACHCANGTFDLTCNGQGSGSAAGMNRMMKLLIGLSVGVVGVITLSVLILYITRYSNSRRGKRETCQNVEIFLLNHGSLAPKRYSYSEIRKITKSFSDKLGQGGYGSVYRGMLPRPDGRLVAVKLLTESTGDGEEFINEVASVSRTSHVNIVNLFGYCYERNKRALVYEFMPNKSLDKFIYDERSLSQLGPERMCKIATGVARGLEYLHKGCNTRIVHFDIKPQNILLDKDFCPKISDFGVAKLCRKEQSILSMLGARGTIGYIAPEVFSRNFGGVSHKSDVYSYGMLVLEMVGARNSFGAGLNQSSESYFPDNIYEQLKIKLHETRDSDDMEIADEGEITKKMLLVAFWCIQTVPSDRPPMSKVAEMLEGTSKCIQIPPKPFLFTTPEPLRQEFYHSASQDAETENSVDS